MPDSQPLRVLILPSWYPTARQPTGGIFIQEQARALATRQDVDVIVLFVDRAPIGEWLRGSKGLRMLGEEHVCVCRVLMPRVPIAWPFLYTVWAVWAYRRLAQRGMHPDVVHAHVALPAGLAGAVIKAIWRSPLVLTEHTSPFSLLLRHPPAAFATRLAICSATKVIAVSRTLRDQITAYPPLRRRIGVIPNVVNTELFKPHEKAAPASTGSSQHRLLFAGEMETSRKGVNYLIRAVQMLKQSDIDVSLDLVGDGIHRSEYEALASALGVAGLCRFHGSLPHKDLARLMRDSDLFVLPSLAETFGVVLIEALASGIPVVATRSGGPEDIVTPDLGVLVEPGNAKALVEGITTVLTRRSAYPGAHLRRIAEERYGQPSVAGRLAELYHEVVRR